VKLKTLELFAGTKSFSKVAQERGHETYTVELEPAFEPDEVVDVRDFTWKGGGVDILWASPPCTAFSVASIGANWMGGHRAYVPKTDKARLGIELVQTTIRLIHDIKPRWWFIENPRGVLRKMPFMEPFRRVTVWYCRYGDKRAKPTDIWTNVPEHVWKPKPPCKNGNPDHEPAPRGAKTGTQGLKGAAERSRIPSALFHEIFSSLNL